VPRSVRRYPSIDTLAPIDSAENRTRMNECAVAEASWWAMRAPKRTLVARRGVARSASYAGNRYIYGQQGEPRLVGSRSMLGRLSTPNMTEEMVHIGKNLVVVALVDSAKFAYIRSLATWPCPSLFMRELLSHNACPNSSSARHSVLCVRTCCRASYCDSYKR
jgi:hypothetical protein